MGRPLIFAANWKMNHGPAETRDFASAFCDCFTWLPERRYLVFPPAVSIDTATTEFMGTPMLVGVQDVHWEEKGAFTGAISVALAKAAGAGVALVGHSERRHVFGETDEDTAKKTIAAIAGGMEVLLCVGELLEEREVGATVDVVIRQLRAACVDLTQDQLPKVIVAYEPVWAIGTGRNATPYDAAAVHREIRRELRMLGHSTPKVIYGGSVNLNNAVSLLSEPEIDGVLVGGASLDVGTWRTLTQLPLNMPGV